jgi:NAD(P)H-hydrate epimerase
MMIVTASQMRAMDQAAIERFGIPGRVLMENAGRGATRFFLDRIYRDGPGKVGVVAGRGNNGGDGFVIARYLVQRGIDVSVYLLSKRDRVQGDAAANLSLLEGLGLPVVEITDSKELAAQKSSMRHVRYWIDALLGTGLNSDVKGLFREMIEWINDCRRPVLSVDIPSGLHTDTGQPCGACIQAAATSTFAFAKLGHLVYPGAGFCGDLEVVDIGIPPHIAEAIAPAQSVITPDQVRSVLGLRAPDSHKGRGGHLLVAAGATGKTGAAVMTGMSALRAGAGLVTLCVPQSLNAVIEAHGIETMSIALPDEGQGELCLSALDALSAAAAGKQCLAVGPGMGTSGSTRDLVRALVAQIELPMVIDADGLNNLADCVDMLQARRAPVVLTPHPGEMARLTGLTVSRIQSDRLKAVRDLSSRTGAVVVLKGARTMVAEPRGHVWINPTGNSGMASGGMGDVLTGLIAGLLAQGRPAAQAACAGVFLHGLAADILAHRTPWGYLATEVMDTVPDAIDRVLRGALPDPLTVRLG